MPTNRERSARQFVLPIYPMPHLAGSRVDSSSPFPQGSPAAAKGGRLITEDEMREVCDG